jgi:hypothetical protein
LQQRGVRLVMLVAAVVFVLSLVLFFSSLRFSTKPYLPFITLVLLLYYVVSYLFSYPVTSVGRLSKSVTHFSEISWEASADRLHIQDGLTETNTDWAVFNCVYETGEHFLLLFASNRTLFQFIPKRAFTSAGQLNSFRDLLALKLGMVKPVKSVNLPELSRRTVQFLIYGSLAILIILLVILSYLGLFFN